MDSIKHQYKERDAKDLVVKTKSHQTEKLIDSLNLPIRYTTAGRIDTHSFLRERMFHLSPGDQQDTAQNLFRMADFIDFSHHLQHTFNVFSLQEIIEDSN